MISHNLTVNFVRPAIQEVLDVSLWNLYLMLITSYINRTQNFELLYLVVFEILIPKVRKDFIESPGISNWGFFRNIFTMPINYNQ